MSEKRRTWRALRLGATLIVGMTAITGLAHTRAARPILALLGVKSGCPLMNASAAELESSRVRGLASLRNDRTAPSRPALELVLGQSTQADVRAWGDARGARCEEELAKLALRCRAGNGDASEDAYFRFDARHALVAVDVVRMAPTAESAAQELGVTSARLERALGAATSSEGAHPPTAGYLATAPLQRASVAYRFRDYAADASATNLGERGFVVREQYRALD